MPYIHWHTPNISTANSLTVADMANWWVCLFLPYIWKRTCLHKYTATESILFEVSKELWHKVKIIEHKVYRKGTEVKDLLTLPKDKQLVTGYQYKLLTHNFSGMPEQFFKIQLATQTLRVTIIIAAVLKLKKLERYYTIIPPKHMIMYAKSLHCLVLPAW